MAAGVEVPLLGRELLPVARRLAVADGVDNFGVRQPDGRERGDSIMMAVRP